MNQILSKAIKHWHYIAPLVQLPSNKKEFETLVERLDELLEIIGDDEHHPLMGLVDIIGNLVAAYEEEQNQDISSTNMGLDALKFLMASHNLHQADLAEIASQGVMSEILNGKRTLNLRQIKLLAKRFNVDPVTFIDE